MLSHLEGRAYNPKAEVALLRSFTSDAVDDFTFEDTGYEGAKLTRRVIYCRGGDFFVVIDSVFSKDEVTASQRWHVDAETQLDPVTGGFRLTRDGVPAWILWKGNMPALSTIEGSEEPFDGWMAREWMEKKASPVISASQTGLRFRFITVIAAPLSGQFTLRKLAASGANMSVTALSGRHQFNLKVEEDRARVTLGEEGNEQPTGRDVKSAWLQTMDLCREAAVSWTAPRPVRAASALPIGVNLKAGSMNKPTAGMLGWRR
jgi:hypothetical protein